MRKSFQEFYTPTATEFAALWRDAFFAIDANVLLDVYRYSPGTTDQLLEVLSKLGSRVWIPYQAAMEYQRNRRGVSATVMDAYEKAVVKLDVAFQELKDALQKNAESASMLEGVAKSFDTAKRKLQTAKSKHAKLVPSERLHERLTVLLDGKVGTPYSAADLDAKHKAAEERFHDKVPPGYKDAAKPIPERYGDTVLWFELLDHAKTTQKPVVLVSGDSKEDWWWQERGKTFGPRPELRRELMAVAGVEFYMYTPERFLENAREYLGSSVTDDAIAEAREIQQHPAKLGFGEAQSLAILGETSAMPGLSAAATDALRKQLSAYQSNALGDALRNIQLSTLPSSAISDALRNIQLSTLPSSAISDALRSIQLSTLPSSAISDALRSFQLSTLQSSAISDALRNIQLSTLPSSSIGDSLRSVESTDPEIADAIASNDSEDEPGHGDNSDALKKDHRVADSTEGS